MSVHPLPSASKVLHLLALAKRNRSVASTRLNAQSSRSHSIFILTVRGSRYARRGPGSGPASADEFDEDEIVERCEGRLNLVDLAGSERVGTHYPPYSASGGEATGALAVKGGGSGVEGDRLKETQCINKSLSALGDVIAALGDQTGKGDSGGGHVPYRNSKLTYLLQYSLGWRAKVLVRISVLFIRLPNRPSEDDFEFITVGCSYERIFDLTAICYKGRTAFFINCDCPFLFAS